MRGTLICSIGLLLTSGVFGCTRNSQAERRAQDQGYRVVQVVGGLEHPWAVAFLPNGDMLVTERPGRLRIVRNGSLVPDAVPGAPEVWAEGQGGLLDLVLAPDFETNRHVYMTYSKPLGDGAATTAVARARFEGDRLHDLEDILVADAAARSGQHFGSRLVFDNDGMLFITIGERGQQAPAQDLSNHIGTTLRVRPDGSPPPDNPFVNRENARPEIYSYGHRNSQGMALQPGTGRIWQNEHGPRGGDEINLIRAGANYGWPNASAGNHYSGEPIPDHGEVPGVTPPILSWSPATAPSGMAFYTGDRFPNWRGHLFNGFLVQRHVRRVVLDGERVAEQEAIIQSFNRRIRDVRSAPDGYLYVLTDEEDGVLARIEPN